MRGPELIARASQQAERVAVVDDQAAWTFGDVLDRSAALATTLLDGRHDLHEARVLLLVPPGGDYVAALWAIWRAGGVAVPLTTAHPPAEWAYAASDGRASFAVAAPAVVDALGPVAVDAHIRIVSSEARTRPARLPDVDPDRAALMLYTSGTTSRPKGVVLTHGRIQAQIESLVEAWDWRSDDRLLHVLPLNHTHGVINALLCPLWCGAVCEMLPRFDPVRVWTRLASGEITVFMAVPTVYQRLLAAWERAEPADRRDWADGARGLRLMVSGSAALPVMTFDRWQKVTGQVLLERYGMTEIGMALSNPLNGERRPGHVGTPLPGVEVRLVDQDGSDVPNGTPGEILVRGPGVFREYWDRPLETADAFTGDGWFRTGDVGTWSSGMVRILGRQSVDIIKTGGEKVSALEVEEVLREHPSVLDCAVVGLPDADWGEIVAAAIVPKAGIAPGVAELKDWARGKLAASKLPKRVAVVAELPRNALGKVDKGRVAGMIQIADSRQ